MEYKPKIAVVWRTFTGVQAERFFSQRRRLKYKNEWDVAAVCLVSPLLLHMQNMFRYLCLTSHQLICKGDGQEL